MILWLIGGMAVVLGIKYFTAVQMRKMQEKIKQHRVRMQQARTRLTAAEERLKRAREEEEALQARHDRMEYTVAYLRMTLEREPSGSASGRHR